MRTERSIGLAARPAPVRVAKATGAGSPAKILGPIGHAAPAAPSGATMVGRNATFRLAAQTASALINVAGIVLLGNALAAHGYGEYAFYYALVPLIASLSDLGVGAIITREIARDPVAGARHLGDALLIKGMVSAALLVAVAATAPIFLDPPRTLLVVLVTATALIDFGQDVGVWIFRGHDRQDLEALLLMVSQLLWLAGIGLCAMLHAPLVMFLAVATIAFLARTLLGAWVVGSRLYRPVFAPDMARLKRLLIEGLPFGLAMFAVVLYGRVGVLMLKGMATDADVAFFNVAYMLSQPLGFISSAFNVSAFPSLSRTAVSGADKLGPVLRRVVKFQFLAALPLSVGLFLLAGRVVPLLLHGEDFRRAGVALQVMSAGLVFVFLNLMSRYVLTALGAQAAYFRAILAGLVVNVALSAVLIGRFGAAGACAALVGGELTVLGFCARALAVHLPVAAWVRELVRPLVAALVMGAVVYALRRANLVLAPLVGAAVYVAMLLWVRALSAEELKVIRGVYISFKLPGSAYLMRAETRP
jgi:O-antigen/teichoic acid export membrane protein